MNKLYYFLYHKEMIRIGENLHVGHFVLGKLFQIGELLCRLDYRG